MKKIKMKDTILSHYQKVHELEMDGFTVRVFKPRTMQQLPAYQMLAWIKSKAKDAIRYMIMEQKADWQLGNPDYGLWDAQTVYHYDPRGKAFNIYIAAILVRPFSREAYDTYCRMHESIDDVNQRMMLMWDSREFDRIGGYDTSYGRPSNMDEWVHPLYHVVNEKDDIEDTSQDFYHESDEDDCDDGDDSDVERRCVKFKVTDKEIIYDAVMGKDEMMKDGGTPLMHACAKAFYEFRKEHPEVTEMHFYTDELVGMEEEVGE